MKKFILLLFTSLLTATLLLCLTIILLGESEWGTQTLFKALRVSVPGKLNYAEVKGTVFHQLIIKQFSYRYKNQQLAFAQLFLGWQPQKLFYRQLWINQLHITQLQLHLSPSVNHLSKKNKFHLPFLRSIVIEKMDIQLQPLSELPLMPSIKPYFIPSTLLTAQGNMAWQINRYFRSNINFQAGKNFLTLQINFTDVWQAQWRLHIINAHQLFTQWYGSCESQGKLQQTLAKGQNLQGNLRINHLVFPQGKIGHLQLNVQWQENASLMNLQAQSLQYQQQFFTRLQGHVQGTFAQHQLQLQFSHPYVSAQIKLNGQWQQNNKTWQGTLQQATFNNRQIGTWHLINNGQLTIKPNTFITSLLYWRGPSGNLKLQGKWQQGRYQLQASGPWPLRPLGIILNAAPLSLEGDAHHCNYQALLYSGKSPLTIKGEVNFVPHLSTTLFIEGNNFLAAQLPSYHIWVSPKIKLSYQQNQWQLNGNIFIPKAIIHQPTADQQIVTLPPEVQFVDRAPSQTLSDSFLSLLSADIQLTLGDQIEIALHGLKAKIRGNLHIHQSPAQPATAVGKLIIVKGSYLAYGKPLQIKNGQLWFNHNVVNNPTLQLIASKRITLLNAGMLNKLTASPSLLPGLSSTPSALPSPTPLFNSSQKIIVGVEVTGPLQNPQLTLFAKPPLITSQADILSYLIFEHPADQLSLTDARLLLQSSHALKLPEPDIEQITRDMQNIFGLDTLNIGPTSYVDPTTGSLQQDTAVMLAKALSPRFYISYSRGLTSSLNVFTLSYLLSKHWSLQSTNGSLGNGIDFIYTLERN